MRRRRSFSLVVVAIGLLLAAAACSAPIDSGPRTLRAAAIPADLRGETTTTSTTVLSTGESEEVTVYFIRPDASTGQDRLVPVKRRISPPASVEKAVQNLFAGPTTQELLNGLRTAISFGPTVLSASVENHIVTVNVSKNFAFGRPTDQINAFAQVVFTATDVAGVTGVLFAVNRHPQEVPQGDGSSTSTPLGRASYAQVAPR